MNNQVNGYVIFYGSKRTEVYASSLLQAKEKGIEHFKVPPSKRHLVVAVLAEKLGKPVQMELF